MLFNSEVWQGMNSTDITMLETIDHQLMKVICNGHAKTPSEFYYLDTAAITINHVIASRRVLYLHNIMNRSEGELVKRVYTAQRNNPRKGDFIEFVKKDFQDIYEPIDEETIRLQKKNTFTRLTLMNIWQSTY